MPLREDILKPIPGDNPSGINLRLAPVYDKIKEARREDDQLAQGAWQHERKAQHQGAARHLPRLSGCQSHHVRAPPIFYCTVTFT